MVKRNDAAPAAGEAAAAGEYRDIPLDMVLPSPRNRKCGDDDPRTLTLAESLERDGLMQPIVVRPLGGGKYEIVCGERRWRAALKNGWRTIRAAIRECDEREASVLRFQENAQRVDLTPLEEGDGVAAMLESFDGDVSEVAARLKWAESWVRRRARIPNLSDAWREELANPASEYAHVRESVERLEEVAILPRETQDALLAAGELLHVRTTGKFRRAVALWMRRLDVKPWSREWEKKAYSSPKRCDACRKRSGSRDGGLFDPLVEAANEDGKDRSDLCLDPACWEGKTVAFVKSEIAGNPGARLIVDGYACIAGDAEKIYGGIITQKWGWEEWKENRQLPAAYTVEAKGVFIAGNRIGQVIDIMLREEAVDQADDDTRAERVAREGRERDEAERKRRALLDAASGLIPVNFNREQIDAATLLHWCVWFGMESAQYFPGDDDPGPFMAWNAADMAWTAIRDNVVHAVAEFVGADDVPLRDPAAPEAEDNSVTVTRDLIRVLGIDVQEVRSRGEALINAK